MNRKKELFKNTVVFGIGVFGAKLMQFVLVPLYTVYLTTAEYGVSDITSSTVTLLLPFLTLGLTHGILRFSINQAENRKTLLITSLSLCLFGTVLLFFLRPLFQMLNLFGGYEYLIPVLFLANSTRAILSNYCKSIDKNKAYAVDGIISACTLAFFSWLFLGVLHIGIAGYLWANIASHGFSALYFFIVSDVVGTLKAGTVKKGVLQETLRYSLPLMPNDLSWWIIQMSDRYMVSWICGAAVNGVYTIAYKIPGIFNILVSIFNQAFSLSSFKECDMNYRNATGKYQGRFFESVYHSYVSVVFFVGGIVILLTQPIALLLIKNEFYISWKYTSLLLIAFILGSIEAFFASILTGIKKTNICFLSTVIGGIVNIIVNILLIPRLQVYGAIIGTVAGYLVVSIIRFWGVKKYVSMDTQNGKTLLSLALVCAQSAFYISSSLWVRALSVGCFVLLMALHGRNLYSLFLSFFQGVCRKLRKHT